RTDCRLARPRLRVDARRDRRGARRRTHDRQHPRQSGDGSLAERTRSREMITIEDQIRRLADIAESAEPAPGSGRPRGRHFSLTSLAIAATVGALVGAAVVAVSMRPAERERAVSTPPSTLAGQVTASYDVIDADLSRAGGVTSIDAGSEHGLQPG